MALHAGRGGERASAASMRAAYNVAGAARQRLTAFDGGICPSIGGRRCRRPDINRHATKMLALRQ